MSKPVLKPTHTMETGTNRGRISMEMSEFPQEIPTQIAGGINDLGEDGGFNDIYTYFLVYPVSAEEEQDDNRIPAEYIQAGGTAERLTVEVRILESNGISQEYTVGRPASASEPTESEAIRIANTGTVHVRPSEVLTAQEAIGLFQHYYDHHEIPEGWHLRKIDDGFLTAQNKDASETDPVAAASASDDAQSSPGAIARYSDSTTEGQPVKAEDQDTRRRADGA